MSDPAYVELAARVEGHPRLEHALQRVWDDITSHLPPPHYHDANDPKEPPVSLLSDA